MGNIVQFVPKRERDAIGNLSDFIRLCREDLTIFGAGLDWYSNCWEISGEYVVKRARKGRSAIVFSTYDTAGSRQNVCYMSQPFLDFAKAYMKYQHSMRPTNDFAKRLVALRALEKTLRERSIDGIARVEKIAPDILNATARLIQQNTPKSAYWIGSQLQMLASFIVTHRLVSMTFSWKNPIKKPNDTNIRVGEESERRRSEKLPSAESIDALIEAYRMAVAPKDVIATSIAALLVCAPDRINEVFRLPVNCEHRGQYCGEEAYGIRWWPSKGAEPMIKWVIKSMEDIAHEAIENIKKHTEEARAIALWYEKNPDKIYLPIGCEHLRNKEYLTANEISEIIGFAGTAWVNHFDMPSIEQERSPGQLGRLPYLYLFKDIEKTVLAMLPKGFPVLDKETGLKYSDALILVPKNLFHVRRGAYRCMFETITTDTFNNQLGSGEKHNKSSVFSRLNIKDASGKSFKITSHQFRHWLNTIAQNAGLSQLHIAKWSGRKDIRQNAAYDHVTGKEIIARARELSGGKLFGPIADFVMNAPMTREEFLRLVFPTAHVTEYGYCIHDWTMMPCEKYRDCLLCTDHLCIKGSIGAENLRKRLDEAIELLRKAQLAVDEGYFGADRWLDHHKKKVDVLRGHMGILDDPAIPDDSVYQLSNISEYSPVSVALEERMTLDDPDAVVLRLVMERLSLAGNANQQGALPCSNENGGTHAEKAER